MVDDDSLTRKSHSFLRWMPAANVAIFKVGLNSTQVVPFLLTDKKPFEVALGKSTASWNTSAHYLSLSSAPARNPIFL